MSAPRQARKTPAPRVQPAPIIAIASGKGGVGKTWLAITLACAWGGAGKRVLLVDCDVGLANVDVQLGVRPSSDIHSVVRGWVELDAAVAPALGGPGHGPGFDLIAGHSGTGSLAAMKLDDTAKICDGVRGLAPQYDRIVLDLAAGVDANVQRFARSADKLVLAITEEPTSLTDAYALAKLLKLNGASVVPSIVVNMAETRQRGRAVYEQFASACHQFLAYRPKLAGVICRDQRVPDSIRAQAALCLRHPQCQAFEDAIRVAEALDLIEGEPLRPDEAANEVGRKG
jgi:flagellar biosynthesis protein FlhG